MLDCKYTEQERKLSVSALLHQFVSFVWWECSSVTVTVSVRVTVTVTVRMTVTVRVTVTVTVTVTM